MVRFHVNLPLQLTVEKRWLESTVASPDYIVASWVRVAIAAMRKAVQQRSLSSTNQQDYH